MNATPVPSYPVTGTVSRALDLLFPPTCVGCRRVGRWICRQCWQDIRWINGTVCLGCGRKSPGRWCGRCGFPDSKLDSLRAVATFDGPIREAVHGLKFHGHHAIRDMMGPLLAAIVPPDVDLIAHVPLHPSRRRERGYDQSRLLVAAMTKTLRIAVQTDLLRRTRRTKQQATLGAGRRRENVAGAFAATRQLDGERILLVD
ncbi:MAG TPA: double zinc ribbon domain-containing protein, partial [Chloroflexota bacterium]|nr:double zinc ribbon domain-containing protein [Chloroflexota bacterium]